MAFNITKITPNTGFLPGGSNYSIIEFTDTRPLYEMNVEGLTRYAVSFYLYVSSTGTTPATSDSIGSYTTGWGSYEGSFSASASILLTIPSGISPGTYYIGGPPLGGTRQTLTVSSIPPVTLTFDLNSGTGTTPNPITQATGSTFTLPSSSGFYRTGYTPLSWNTASNGTGVNYNFGVGYAFSANTTLYVKWNINSYTIHFQSNGGSFVNSITQNYGSTVTAPSNPTRQGYTFAGWYSDGELTSPYTFTTMPAENRVLYAKWTINQYTITFNSNGGTSVTSKTQAYMSSVTEPSSPTRTGYTFIGWFYDSGLTSQVSFPIEMPLNGTTLYAKWTINYYILKFFNGAVELSSVYRAYGSAIPAPATNPTKIDPKNRYVFAGWNTDPNATVGMELGNMPANNINFYAIYTAYKNSFKINNKNVNMFLGETQIKAVYQGETLIWEKINE